MQLTGPVKVALRRLVRTASIQVPSKRRYCLPVARLGELVWLGRRRIGCGLRLCGLVGRLGWSGARWSRRPGGRIGDGPGTGGLLARRVRGCCGCRRLVVLAVGERDVRGEQRFVLAALALLLQRGLLRRGRLRLRLGSSRSAGTAGPVSGSGSGGSVISAAVACLSRWRSASSLRASASRRLRYSWMRAALGSVTASSFVSGSVRPDGGDWPPEKARTQTMTVATPIRTQAWTFFGRTPGGLGALSRMVGGSLSVSCWGISNLGAGRPICVFGRSPEQLKNKRAPRRQKLRSTHPAFWDVDHRAEKTALRQWQAHAENLDSHGPVARAGDPG